MWITADYENHMVDMCSLTQFESGVQSLRCVDDALNWREIAATTALVK